MYFNFLVRQANLLKGPIILGVFLLLWSMGPTPEIRFPHAHITLAGIALLQIAEAWLHRRNDALFPDRETIDGGELALLGASLVFCYFLVRFTGGMESKYSLIFLLPILTGATRFRLSGALGVTLAAIALYASFLLTDRIDQPEKQLEETIELCINLFFSFIIGFIIALASEQERTARARLKRSGEETAAANRDLRRAQEDLKRKIAELEVMEKAVRRADRLAALGEMAAGMAHEIRTPLGVIQSSAEILARRVLEEEPDNRLVKVIVEEIDRLDRLIRDFLSFARPPSPRYRLQAMAPVIQRAIHLVDTRAETRGIRVDFRFREDFPALEMDEDLIHQCVLNLLVNAIDAAPENGSIRIALEAGAGSKEAILTVRDDGPGVAPGEESRIFNPFHTTKEGGTGLGLSIVQQIVSLHGGRIEVTNAEGGGACFEVRLPLHGGGRGDSPRREREKVTAE